MKNIFFIFEFNFIWYEPGHKLVKISQKKHHVLLTVHNILPALTNKTLGKTATAGKSLANSKAFSKEKIFTRHKDHFPLLKRLFAMKSKHQLRYKNIDTR